jgi:serine acetyltransferase
MFKRSSQMSNRHVQNLRHLLRTDYRRYLKNNHYDLNNLPGLIQSIRLILRSPGIVAVFIQRLDYLNFSWYGDKGLNLMKYDLRIVLFILNYFKRTIFKIAIPKTISIGPGLVISGRGEIIVGAKEIGENCTLHPRVTIGVGGKNRDKPIIGDNVLVESDTLIFGGIRIGNNVTFKKGTVCSKNIPDNCIVAGNPARIIDRKQTLRRDV